MNGSSTQELEEKLREAQEDLRSIRASLRAGRLVTVVGTLCGFIIVAIFVWLFLSPILEIMTSIESGKMGALLKKEIEKQGIQREVTATFKEARDRLLPVYKDVVLQKLAESGVYTAAGEEASALLDEVWPVYQKAMAKKLEELGLDQMLEEEAVKLTDDLVPYILNLAMKKLQDSGLTGLVLEEATKASRELGPLYADLLMKEFEKAGLVEALNESLVQIANEVWPAFEVEIDKARPELMKALDAQASLIAADLETILTEQLVDTLRKTLMAQQTYIEKEVGLSDAELMERLEILVEAGKQASVNLIKDRTKSHLAILEESNKLITEIPLARERDPQELLDQIVKVSILLLKEKLPKPEVPLE